MQPRLSLAFFAALLAPTPASAYSFFHDGQEEPRQWALGAPWDRERPYLPLVGNALNRGAVEPQDLRRAVVNALFRWQEAASDGFEWDYWQGTDLEVYPPAVLRDGVSTIHFAVASGVGSVPANAAAYTQLWFDDDTGQVVEIDIVLNDRTFEFTSDPAEALYQQGLGNRILYLDDVVAHELGHALGLHHSGNLQATMFTWGWRGQASLGCDDHAGMRELFPPPDPVEWAELSGTVLDPEEQPVFGAQAVAVSVPRGAVEATTLTDESGRFHFAWLPPGEYLVYVEPWYPDTTTLDGRYAEVWHRDCFGSPWSRTFLPGRDIHRPQVVRLEGGQHRGVPPLQVTCSGGAGVPTQLGSHRWQSAPTVFRSGRADSVDPDEVERFTILDRAPAGGCADPTSPATCLHRWFKLEDVEGDLELRALSYSLYHPVAYRMSLWTRAILEAEVTTPLVRGERFVRVDPDVDHKLWDGILQADDLPRADYWVQLEGVPLAEAAYPRGDLYLDTTPFVVLLGRIDDDDRPDRDCWSAARFPTYLTPPGAPRTYDPYGGQGAWEPWSCSTSGGRTDRGLLLPLLALLRRRKNPGGSPRRS